MAYPTIKFKSDQPQNGVEQLPQLADFVMVSYDGDTYLACGADGGEGRFILFQDGDGPFLVDCDDVTVIKDVEVEITVK